MTDPVTTARPTAIELVTCPECGLAATVDLTRRNATDFCRNCDYPLFWARGTVIPPFGDETSASLRRLPGTAGRAQRPSVPCPTCGEPNLPNAEYCIRCSGPMVLVEAPAPEPIPEPAPKPEPEWVEPEDEPLPERNWWLIGILCFCVLAILIIVGWAALI